MVGVVSNQTSDNVFGLQPTYDVHKYVFFIRFSIVLCKAIKFHLLSQLFYTF